MIEALQEVAKKAEAAAAIGSGFEVVGFLYLADGEVAQVLRVVGAEGFEALAREVDGDSWAELLHAQYNASKPQGEALMFRWQLKIAPVSGNVVMAESGPLGPGAEGQ